MPGEGEFRLYVTQRAASMERAPPPQPIVIGPEEDDELTPAGSKDALYGYAEGQSFVIEYVDSRGRYSRRRITVWGLVAGVAGIPNLHARCHERRADRHFRVDRIRCAIDYDGVVHENVPQFLGEIFGGRLESLMLRISDRAGDDSASRWKALLDIIRPSAALLNAIAFSDGAKTAEEIEEVVRYSRRLLRRRGFEAEDQEVEAVARYVRRLRPPADTIASLCDRVLSAPPDEIVAFLRAGIAVMDADGRRHPAEEAVLNAAAQHLAGVSLV